MYGDRTDNEWNSKVIQDKDRRKGFEWHKRKAKEGEKGRLRGSVIGRGHERH
jgi:hypothetical protein